MVLNATFSNISVISWRSVLLVAETGGPRENHGHFTTQSYIYESWKSWPIPVARSCIRLYRKWTPTLSSPVGMVNPMRIYTCFN